MTDWLLYVALPLLVTGLAGGGALGWVARDRYLRWQRRREYPSLRRYDGTPSIRL